jgi:hypothetical protein
MQVLFESRNPGAAHLRATVERRVQFVLRRLSWLVPRARVRLSDLNTVRSGVDKHCQVELNTKSSGTLVITSVAREWRHALDNALARAVHKLVRKVQRNRFRGLRPDRMTGFND